MNKAFFGTAEPIWLCTGCRVPNPDIQAVDVSIQERRLNPKVPLSFVFGYGVCIAHRNLIAALGQEPVANDLWLGTVFDNDGVPMQDWVTVRGHERTIIRGSKEISHRVCPKCGRDAYFAGGTRYLFPAPNAKRTLLESDLRGLVIVPELFQPTWSSIWPKLGIEKLKVNSTSLDGLGRLKA